MFDIITCASTFVLMEDQEEAVESWAKLPKKGGKVILDIPTGDNMVKGLAFERIAERLRIKRQYTREEIDSEEKLRALLTPAELGDGGGFCE